MAPVLVTSANGSIAMAVDAIKSGAADFIEKPFRTHDIVDRIDAAIDEFATAQFEPAALVARLRAPDGARRRRARASRRRPHQQGDRPAHASECSHGRRLSRRHPEEGRRAECDRSAPPHLRPGFARPGLSNGSAAGRRPVPRPWCRRGGAPRKPQSNQFLPCRVSTTLARHLIARVRLAARRYGRRDFMRITARCLATTSLVLVTMATASPSWAADVDATSAIDTVTVYPDGATVTRVIAIDLAVRRLDAGRQGLPARARSVLPPGRGRRRAQNSPSARSMRERRARHRSICPSWKSASRS